MPTQQRVLVADDDDAMRAAMRRVLERKGYIVVEAVSGEEALDLLAKNACDAVVLDVSMPGIGGIEVLRRIREGPSLAEVVMATADADVRTAVEATRRGALDYVLKPYKPEELERAVARALEKRQLTRRSAAVGHLVEKKSFFPEIIGDSPAIREAVKLARKVASSDCAVLIEGETGTGKELIAREIHRMSPRAAQPLISLNCAGLTETLLESELFGHEKGSFTGANRLKQGILELTDGGTLFLDEIGEMSLALQAKLLRTLENGEIRRVGGNEILTVNVRFIAATHRDMTAEVKAQRFREDLYYHLNTVSLRAPSLRERREDIPALLDYFLQRFSPDVPKRISPEALRILQDYAWPGNVRELRNTTERFAILVDGNLIEPRHLPMDTFRRDDAWRQGDSTLLSLSEVEKRHICLFPLHR